MLLLSRETPLIALDQYRPRQIYRGTESGNPHASRRFAPDGEMGRAIYGSMARWLAASYGGGPKAREGHGRTVHTLKLRALDPDQYGYVQGGAREGELARLLTAYEGRLMDYEPVLARGAFARSRIAAVAASAGICVIVGLPGSIAENQVAILEASVIEPEGALCSDSL